MCRQGGTRRLQVDVQADKKENPRDKLADRINFEPSAYTKELVVSEAYVCLTNSSFVKSNPSRAGSLCESYKTLSSS